MGMMTVENVESLLCEWHQWSNNISNVMGLGYGSTNHIARLARFSRSRQQDDDVVDDIDHRANEADMALCDSIIGGMMPMLRIAISLRARHLAQGQGLTAWHNPRWPKGAALQALTDEAISVFRRRWEAES